jgi:hypothetical protein
MLASGGGEVARMALFAHRNMSLAFNPLHDAAAAEFLPAARTAMAGEKPGKQLQTAGSMGKTRMHRWSHDGLIVPFVSPCWIDAKSGKTGAILPPGLVNGSIQTGRVSGPTSKISLPHVHEFRPNAGFPAVLGFSSTLINHKS